MGNPHDSDATLTGLKRSGVLVVALALVLAGCGKFSSSDSKSSTSTTAAGEIGGGLGIDTTQPAVTQAGPAPTAAAADPCTTKPRSSAVVRDDRLKLALNVSGVCFKHSDDFTVSLVVTNTSSEVVHYDPNQRTVFTIKAPAGEQKRRWEDSQCQTRTADIKPARDLAPGASVTLTATYPAAKDLSNRETCRRLETGDYEVQATFLVCDASYQDGYCETAKDTQVQADPVTITLAG